MDCYTLDTLVREKKWTLKTKYGVEMVKLIEINKTEILTEDYDTCSDSVVLYSIKKAHIIELKDPNGKILISKPNVLGGR